MQGVKNGVMPSHNEYFDNAAEGQNKAAEWVGYIFPTPLSRWTDITYTFYDGLFFYHISLKMLAIATAMSALYASSDKKIVSVKKGDYFCPPT